MRTLATHSLSLNSGKVNPASALAYVCIVVAKLVYETNNCLTMKTWERFLTSYTMNKLQLSQMSMKFRHLSMHCGVFQVQLILLSAILVSLLLQSHLLFFVCLLCSPVAVLLWSLNTCSSSVCCALLSASCSLCIWSHACRCSCVSAACDCLVPYVTVVLPLVAPVSLQFSDACVAPWHAEVQPPIWPLSPIALLCLRWYLSLSSLALHCAGVSLFAFPSSVFSASPCHCSLFTAHMSVTA